MRLFRPCGAWSTPVIEEERRPVPCALCGGTGKAGDTGFRPSLRCAGPSGIGVFFYVRCARCGLVQINPQPVASSVRGRYGGDYLRYELDNEENFLRLQILGLADAGFAEIERELFAAGTPSVLDVGCATGAMLARLRGRGWRTCGSDISPAAAYAREKRGLDVRSEAVEDCRFPDAAFDVVLASHLIEHLNAPRLFLRELRRILKPGGRVILTTPNIAGFQARLFAGRWRCAIFDHLYLFSARTLKAMLRAEGFTVTRVRTWGGLAAGTAPALLKRAADRLAKAFGFGDVVLVVGERE